MDKATVLNVIYDLHKTLKEYGIKDNHIALFGSFHNGNMHEDSDIDIIVVSSLFEGKNLLERVDITAQAQMEVKRKHVVPMDILLKTPKEYDYSRKTYFDSEIIV